MSQSDFVFNCFEGSVRKVKVFNPSAIGYEGGDGGHFKTNQIH